MMTDKAELREVSIDTTAPALQRFARAMMRTGARVHRTMSLRPETEWGRGVTVTMAMEFPGLTALDEFRACLGKNLVDLRPVTKVKLA